MKFYFAFVVVVFSWFGSISTHDTEQMIVQRVQNIIFIFTDNRKHDLMVGKING